MHPNSVQPNSVPHSETHLKKTKMLWIGCVVIVVLATNASADPDSSPDIQWTGTNLLTQETVDFPDVLNGKPAVFVFWATWCPYCKAFMPYARDIQTAYAEHGIQIIAPNIKQGTKADPRVYVEQLGFPLIAIASADHVAALHGIEFTPGLIVVDGQGTEVYRRKSTNLPPGKSVAEQWADEIRAALDELVGRR
jgi:thiol-disulfide isomerase/thioredoxin